MASLAEIIITVINEKAPLRGTQLIVDVMEAVRRGEMGIPLAGAMANNSDLVMETIEEMVKEDQIIEIEYIDPDMDYRMKSMFFKRGTIFSSPNNLFG